MDEERLKAMEAKIDECYRILKYWSKRMHPVPDGYRADPESAPVKTSAKKVAK